MDLNAPHRELLQVLVRFAETLISEYQVDEALDRLMQRTPELLGVDGAGVMLEDDEGELRFVAASDEKVQLIEQYQVQTGQGPCVRAYETGEVVQADDLREPTPFPSFAEVALKGGMAAVHSFPMVLQGVRVGALNLYRTTPGSLPAEGVETGRLLSAVATTYLFSARQHDRLSKQIEGMRAAMERNGAVDQAKGVLMHQLGIDDREAFARLRRHARAHRTRVVDIGQRLMDGEIDVEVFRDV